MTISNSFVIGKNDQGIPIRIAVVPSGSTDQFGNILYQLAVVANSPTVSAGISGAPFHSANQSGSAVAVTDSPATGKHLIITNLVISAGAAMIVTFTEETSGTVILVVDMAANSTVTIPVQLTLPTINKKLFVQTSATGNIDILAQWYSA